MENCSRQSYFFANGKQGGSCNPTKWHWKKRVICMKPLHSSWHENTCTKHTPPPFYVVGVRLNAYFYSCGHYIICGQIIRTENFREFCPWRYGIGSSAGVDFKIWGGQEKNSAPVFRFSSTVWPIIARPGQTTSKEPVGNT